MHSLLHKLESASCDILVEDRGQGPKESTGLCWWT